MNQLMLGIRNHHVANEVVKLVKKYFINSEKIMKRLQLTVFKRKEKVGRDIRTIAAYILNDFKRAHSKIYSDLFASTQKNLRAIDLMIRDMSLIENSQANALSDDDFVKNFSIIANKADIIEAGTSTSSTRAVVFKFLILKIVSATSRKASQAEKIDQLNKSSVVSSAVNSVSFQARFFNLNKEVFVSFINQDTRLAE